MTFTYSKTTKSYIDYDNDRVYDDYIEFDYEPEAEDLKEAIAVILVNNAHKKPISDIEYRVCKKITKNILNEMQDLNDLYEAYKDELKDYFEEEAKESCEL